jgi:hypothetical protein
MYQIITLDLINEAEKGYRVSTEIRQKGFSTEINNKEGFSTEIDNERGFSTEIDNGLLHSLGFAKGLG